MTPLELPPVGDRSATRALFLDIREAVGPQPLAIDASKVERIGQAMLQLLVSASQSEAGIAITSPSDAFREAVRLAGLEQAFSSEIDG